LRISEQALVTDGDGRVVRKLLAFVDVLGAGFLGHGGRGQVVETHTKYPHSFHFESFLGE